MAKDSRVKQIISFGKYLPKIIELDKSKVKISKDHLSGREYIDILINPVPAADKKAISDKWTLADREKLQKWYHTHDMGFLRLQVVHYGKRKEPALFISAVQPGVFWEMPSKFRRKYADWYKKLYEEIEKTAKKQGIKRVLISTPRAVRRTSAKETVGKIKFPYHMLSQLYHSFPEKQGFEKRKVLLQGKSPYIEETGKAAVSRKLWYKNLRRR